MTLLLLIKFVPKLILEFAFDPQNVVQISAGLEHVFASYTDFHKVCK